MKAKKIGILNFPGHMNHGANLTAHALQKILHLNGYNACNLHLHCNPQIYKIAKYTDFADAYIKMTETLAYSNGQMQAFNDQFDTFITGSDQVWRYDQTGDFSWKEFLAPSFFLSFAQAGKRRISMAASFGTDHFDAPDHVLSMVKEELSRFSAISVREPEGQALVYKLSGLDSKLLIDPVFYLNREYWNKLINNEKSPCNKSYVAHASLYIATPVERFLKANRQYESINLLQGNTIEWLHCIRDAKFVLTDSFHVLCFCLIFGTPFACISRPDQGLSRFNSLAKQLNFDKKRIINSDTCSDITAQLENIMQQGINWQLVYSQITQRTQEAVHWLRNALDSSPAPWKGSDFKMSSRSLDRKDALKNAQYRHRQLLQRRHKLYQLILKISPIKLQFIKSRVNNIQILLNKLSW